MDQGLAFIIGGFPLLLGPVLRGLTVLVVETIEELRKGNEKLIKLGYDHHLYGNQRLEIPVLGQPTLNQRLKMLCRVYQKRKKRERKWL